MTAPGTPVIPQPGWWVRTDHVGVNTTAGFGWAVTLIGGPGPALIVTPTISASLHKTAVGRVAATTAPSMSATGVIKTGFDAVGTFAYVDNQTGISQTTSGSHTASGGIHNVVIAFVNTTVKNGTQSANVSVTYGGTTMTAVPGGSINYRADNGHYEDVFAFYLFNPPSGAKTVTYSFGLDSTLDQLFATCNTVSYKGVSSLGTPASSSNPSSASASLSSVTCPANGMVTAMVGTALATGAAISAFNQTQRFNQGTAGQGTYALIGDAGGASTESFTATLNSATHWGALAVPLSP